MEFVGRITGMVDCQWADDTTATINGAYVPLGRKYALFSGLMEITYDTGAKVVLQGPTTYEVDSAAGGYLAIGKLTARLEKKEARGQGAEVGEDKLSSPSIFAVRTPTAVVTDLGTEFGVEVDASGSTTSHVFRGSVLVQIVAANGVVEQDGRVLRENQSARAERTGNGAVLSPVCAMEA